MAKKLTMLLVVAGLLVVGLVGFLYFSPSGMTIEKFQNAPAEPAFVPPVLEKPPRLPGSGRVLKDPPPPPSTPLAPQQLTEGPSAMIQSMMGGTSAVSPMPVKGLNDSSPPPSTPLPPPPPTQVPSFCGNYGYPSPDNSTRLYSEKECGPIFGGTLYRNGICILKDGRKLSDECRDLNNQATPVKPQQIQAGPSAIQSMMPPPPPPPVLEEPPPPPPVLEEPTPIAPTPASSEAALRLTPAQCSALCPVTQETCESMFSCRTRLEPIGVTPMSMTSTPAAVV